MAAALLRQGKVDQEDWRAVGDLAAKGYEDARMIRPLSGLRRPIEGADSTTRALGARLLVGTNWIGEIDLADEVTMGMFGRWKECRDRSTTLSKPPAELDPPTSPGR